MSLVNIVAIHQAVKGDADDLIRPFVKTIIGSFVLDKKDDEEEGGDANGQPQDMDQGGGFVPPTVAEGDGEKIFKHALAGLIIGRRVDHQGNTQVDVAAFLFEKPGEGVGGEGEYTPEFCCILAPDLNDK
jgi:hypothetical protein